MTKNPNFGIEQVEAYVDYLSRNTDNLANTVESSFLPILQKIFFYQAYDELSHGCLPPNRTPAIRVFFDCGRAIQLLVEKSDELAVAARLPLSSSVRSIRARSPSSFACSTSISLVALVCVIMTHFEDCLSARRFPWSRRCSMYRKPRTAE